MGRGVPVVAQPSKGTIAGYHRGSAYEGKKPSPDQISEIISEDIDINNGVLLEYPDATQSDLPVRAPAAPKKMETVEKALQQAINTTDQLLKKAPMEAVDPDTDKDELQSLMDNLVSVYNSLGLDGATEEGIY